MMIRSSCRRAFLQGVGLGAFALPFLRTLETRAAAPADARRLVVFTSAIGTVMSEYWPGAGNQYKRILKPLEPLKNKLLVMRGINMESAYKNPVPPDHDPDFPGLLVARQSTGRFPGDLTGISIDQHIANAVGNKTKFASLQLGVNTFSLYGCVSSRGPKQGIIPERSPYAAFDRIFKDVAADPTDLAKIHRERKSIIDLVLAEADDLRCALGAEERPKLDAHLQSLRELERGLETPLPGAGDGCVVPNLGAPVSETGAGLVDSVPQLLKLQMDIVATAMACDLSRIFTLQFSHGASPLPFRWLGINFPHHSIAHGTGPVTATAAQRTEWLLKIEEWTAKQFMYLIQKINNVEDGGASMLDHSAVIWAHEQQNGANHDRRNMPFVLAGSCRGAFTVNRAVDFGGKPHSALLMSLANAMGVPTTQFGDPDFSKGPLAGL